MTGKRRILVIDDEIDMLETCQRLLERMGYECTTLRDSTRSAEAIAEVQPDIVLTDLVMPQLDGLEVLRITQDILPDALVIIITGYATVESAVKAMKDGAFDYLPKPFSAEQLEVTLKRAVERLALREENQILRSQLEERYNFANLIGANGGLQQVVEILRKASDCDANVLILGESGTGKELVARSIHANSKRRQGPFIAVNCASLPDELLESELFGHEKGAFTGAHASKEGLMELAHKGTLFLDEIGELSWSLQAKLLRALEERAFRRVGGTKEIKVDVRVLAATNRNLEEAVERREFREDLYYRLNVITITLPPLRERRQDIRLLANHFLQHFSRQMGKPVKGISPKALELLQQYSWPGNVRELRNAIERAVALCDSKVIMPEDLPEKLQKKEDVFYTSPRVDLPFHKAKAQWIETFEVRYLLELLKKNGGNISQAAREAGVNRKTIHRLLKKHKIPFDDG
ncbi:sigma-54-dependent transcriptional regulator [Thermanaeromonas sp. C210]|uniref:sigma-54-dependent transcriptional regulator n=1 Tax=Thermanaeromonas sp. C210 TaxID=2731925 RepID=UPI00155CDAF0|nr:sigma-54 dependent transcriptional regulator [Thermanaeromonas sp. C210]GFN22845.1 DNA-binding response regulator [Thermanaeromonas sp. C210]